MPAQRRSRRRQSSAGIAWCPPWLVVGFAPTTIGTARIDTPEKFLRIDPLRSLACPPPVLLHGPGDDWPRPEAPGRAAELLWSSRWGPSPPAAAAWPGRPTAGWSSSATRCPASGCGPGSPRRPPRTCGPMPSRSSSLARPGRAPCPHAGPGRCGGCDFQHVELGRAAPPQGWRGGRTAGPAGRARAVGRGGGGRGRRTGSAGAPGCAWRSTAAGAWGSGGTGPTDLEPVDECPMASPPSRPPAPSPPVARRHRARDRDRDRAGRRGGRGRPRGPGHAATPRAVEAPGSCWAARSGAPRVPCTPTWRAALPDLGRRVLAGARRRAGGAARRRPRRPATAAGAASWTSTPAPGCSRSHWPKPWGRGSVLAVERDRRACADARHNGAGLPHLDVLEAG